MNRYARLAMSHWQRCAPRRVRALEDPAGFFTDLGEQVQAQVSDLARLLAGPDPARETYKQKVARLRTATRTAEEVVMAQLVWTPAPELTLAEAREEWEQTSPTDEALISWAEYVLPSMEQTVAAVVVNELVVPATAPALT